MLNQEQTKLIESEKEKLITKLKQKQFSESDLKIVNKGIDYAILKHSNQYRKSGEPYVIHPIETACILVDWDADLVSIISGLLHDLIEDTDTTKEDIVNEFGEEIGYIVEILSKVSETIAKKRNENSDNIYTKINTESDDDYFVKIFFSLAKDIRVALVKLADRMHNISTIEFLKKEKQERIARETINLYANLAGRLGMYFVKTQLLDLSFKVLNPKEYESTKSKIDTYIKNHQHNFKEFKEKISIILDTYNIEYELFDRVKGIYSTVRKINKNHFSIDSIHDLYAIRIVTNETLDCYKILGLVHTNFKTIKKTFNDFISNPKTNLYQSIHTTVNLNNSTFEVQIRTKKMDDISKYGPAAHWLYKEGRNIDEKNYDFVSRFSDITHAFSNNEFERRIMLKNEEIFDIYVSDEEKSSSLIVNENIKAIDVAYRFNPNKFEFVESISVNGVSSPLDRIIKKNDNIFIKYSDIQKITIHWLNYSNDEVTKKHIKEYLSKMIESLSENAKDFFNNLQNELKDKWVGEQRTKDIIINEFGFNTIDSFLQETAKSFIDQSTLYKLFSIYKQERKKARNKLWKFFAEMILKKNCLKLENIIQLKDVEFASCCNKVIDAPIIGFLSGDLLSIHSTNCINIEKLSKKNKIIPVFWDLDEAIKQDKQFLCSFKLKYIWSPNAANEVVYWINKVGMKLNSFSLTRIENSELCEMNITLYSNNITKIDNWLLKLKSTYNLKEIIKK